MINHPNRSKSARVIDADVARKVLSIVDAGISANLCDEAIDAIEEWKQAASVEAGLRREAHDQLATARAEQIRLSLALSIMTNERDEARALGRIA